MSIEQSIIATLRSKNWIEDCSDSIPDLAAAFDIQDAVTKEISKDFGGFAGYKIAMNSVAAMQQLNLPHPAAARIFANQVFDDGAFIDVNNFQKLMIEPEIAVVLARDITPTDDTSVENIDQYVDRFYPAFEVLNRRSVKGLDDVPTMIAHNIFNAGVVLGGQGLPNDADLDFVTDCRDNGEIIAKGQGLAPQDPREALAFLAQHFTGRGETMPAGSVLLLGTHCPIYEVSAGRKLSLEMGALGKVSLST